MEKNPYAKRVRRKGIRISSRPVELLHGENRHAVRYMLGNVHCGSSILVAIRKCRPKNLRKAPRELRRGLALCILETWREYQAAYRRFA